MRSPRSSRLFSSKPQAACQTVQLDSYQPLERDAVVKWPKAETESAACACVELPVPGGMFGRNVNVHLCCSSKTAAAKSLERDALVKLPNYWPCLTCACMKPRYISEAIAEISVRMISRSCAVSVGTAQGDGVEADSVAVGAASTSRSLSVGGAAACWNPWSWSGSSYRL